MFDTSVSRIHIPPLFFPRSNIVSSPQVVDMSCNNEQTPLLQERWSEEGESRTVRLRLPITSNY